MVHYICQQISYKVEQLSDLVTVGLCDSLILIRPLKKLGISDTEVCIRPLSVLHTYI